MSLRSKTCNSAKCGHGRWPAVMLSALLALAGALFVSFPQPSAAAVGGLAPNGASDAAAIVDLVKTELCGRGLSGRCTRGRAACSRGTPEQCKSWKRWSEGCSVCAKAFMACRQKVGHGTGAPTCDKCRAAHDVCEQRNRAAR